MNTKNTPSNKMTGFRMIGGIDIDLEEMKKLPEAKYWSTGAAWASGELLKMFGRECDQLDRIIETFWRPGNSWMKICLRAEHMLDLCKALVNKETK